MTQLTDYGQALLDALNAMTLQYSDMLNRQVGSLVSQGVPAATASNLVAAAGMSAAICIRRTAEAHGDAAGGDDFTRHIFENTLSQPERYLEIGPDGSPQPVKTH